MEVELAVTRSCNHCPILETELKKLGIPYAVRYAEDDEELQEKYNIRNSPNILVDDKLVFRGMPSISELRSYFGEKAKSPAH